MPLPFPTPAQHDLVVLTNSGPLTRVADDNGNVNGLEHDLAEAFARELGVAVKHVVVPQEEMDAYLARGNYHLAAGWLSPVADRQIQATPPIFQTHDVLAQNDASLPLTELDQLSGKTVHAMAGSRQAANLHRLAKTIPQLTVVEVRDGDILDLLESLGNSEVELVAMDNNLEDIANQFVPNLRTSLTLSDEQPIVWLLGPHPNPELAARAKAFIERIQLDGTLAKLEDRYFGHVRRLNQADVIKFLGEIETTLPDLRKFFYAAEVISGIDWRLIAAVAYHESHWDANATSPTGVRGIMMLTEETADRMKVSNRLNPRESIVAGARYINQLKEMQPDEAREPDRTWLALASYNIGPGHFNAARTIARQLGADPTAWFEMKHILPLLAKPKYYERLKSGRARGGEAVILVENIRSYYDILVRNEPALQSISSKMEKRIGLQGDGPGLKLKR
ncbi:membrane-bound lytic murein transglycosylase MltF [Dechloromonas denitrificans]|uniref:membrane-bound lytic murein transglycosylase MltF n=1 Tax=Dechloromonas denitrificans TaxID=281362 RepID=UPI001CF900B4|nr:membrane-bound lytic murein transglycosylase MltF [Dechloromonas denitrificans]UCV04954.1 membrane-bound lytic murein transglycosylase MltF [Dechloromonas denitrificans]